MKITHRQLRQIIKEEITRVVESSHHIPPVKLHFEFEMGKDLDDPARISSINQGPPHAVGPLIITKTITALQKALKNTRPGYKPVKIIAGTSGTGSEAQNDNVMNQRIDSAFEYLYAELETRGGTTGGTGLKLDPDSIDNIASIERQYTKVVPGQRIAMPPGSGVYRIVPEDPSDLFFVESQYVTIIISDAVVTPDYVTLADEFIEATLRSRLPTYSGVPVWSSIVPSIKKARVTWSDSIYKILDQLRDGNDFDLFNAAVKKIGKGMDFDTIACRHAVTIPKKFMGLSIPGWMGPGTGLGPKEIGEDIASINLLLTDRFGRDPIKC